MMQERFCQFWAGKPDTPEGHLAEAHRRAQADFELMQTELVRCIRVEKKDGQLIPIFSEDAAMMAGPHWDAEKRVRDIKVDIETFLGISGGELSLNILLDKIARARRQVNEGEHKARVELERSIRNSRGDSGSIEKAQESPAVQAAMDRRDRLQAEMSPIIKELERKLADAKAILQKYDASVWS